MFPTSFKQATWPSNAMTSRRIYWPPNRPSHRRAILPDRAPLLSSTSRHSAFLEGYSLHAAHLIDANDRDGLERLAPQLG